MKHIRYISFLMLLFLNVEIIAQINRNYETNPDRKRTNIWYFGQNAGIDFNTNPPTALSDGKINTWEGCSSICDTSGNLLFYSDGITVWDKNHQIMTNGTGLKGDKSSTQSALILHHPENDSIYYIVSTPYAYDYNIGARINIVNIFQNKVTDKNIVLHSNSSEKITAVNHSNGKDIWIVGHEYGNSKFFSYLLTSNGIVECGMISSIGTSLTNNEFNNQGQMKFSSDGSMAAICHNTNMLVEILVFNNTSGSFTLKKSINTGVLVSGILPYSLDFSSSGRYIYIFLRDNYILKYDILVNSLQSLKKLNVGSWGQCGKSPLGDILFHYRDSTFLNSIENQNDTNTSLNFHFISIAPQKTLASLPNFNQSYFHTPSIDFTYKFNCINNSIELEGRDTFYADSFNWKLKKVFGFGEQLQNVKKTNINFADTGLYDIIFIASKGSRSDTVIKQIYVYPKIKKDFLGSDSIYKSNIPFNLQLKTPSGMHCIRWHDSSTSETFTTDTAGIYFVQITTKSFCNVIDTIQIIRCVNELTKPVLFNNADTLYSHQVEADSFIWFRNNEKYRITKDSFIVLTDTGAYRVEVAKKGYCNNSSLTIHYRCINNLMIPNIYLSRDTLFTYQLMADSFMWFKNNQLLQVTKQPFIKLSDTGTYRVEASRKLHCNRSSSNLHISNLNVNINLAFDLVVKIYPNPADESITFEMQETNGITIRLYDAKGNLIYERYSKDLKTQMDISSLAQGLYVIELINEQALYHSKILIQ